MQKTDKKFDSILHYNPYFFFTEKKNVSPDNNEITQWNLQGWEYAS